MKLCCLIILKEIQMDNWDDCDKTIMLKGILTTISPNLPVKVGIVLLHLF